VRELFVFAVYFDHLVREIRWFFLYLHSSQSRDETVRFQVVNRHERLAELFC
jgi:hypothetical protein